MFDRNDLRWDGNRLRLHSGRLLVTVEPDQGWNGMWRVRMPDGHVTDMVNFTRARHTAQSLALNALDSGSRGDRV